MELVVIAPAQLRAVWNQIRAGLDSMPAEDWIAEDVYHAIKSGGAALYVAYEGAEYAGFMVVQLRNAEFSGTPFLHVWLAYNQGSADVIWGGETFLRHLAAQSNATRISFGSPRKGWAKRYPLISATYEVSL